jgi:hypothetical protein
LAVFDFAVVAVERFDFAAGFDFAVALFDLGFDLVAAPFDFAVALFDLGFDFALFELLLLCADFLAGAFVDAWAIQALLSLACQLRLPKRRTG